MPETVVVVPIRSFDDAKTRLAEVLDLADRRTLARAMAATVLRAALELPVVVVSDDAEVIDWAFTTGARSLPVGVTGLDRSITAAVDHLAAEGVDRVIVAHADLPHAHDLGIVADPTGNLAAVAIAPDRHHDGSNVLSVPTGAGFRFAYGPGSFARHVAEAERLGLPVTVVDDASLAWDVDSPDDLPFDWRSLLPHAGSGEHL